ncbi:MAG: HTTM domain-containing protein [Bacteroidota bacterium]
MAHVDTAPAPPSPTSIRRRLLSADADALVLAVFRIGFGAVMALSMLRFLLLGWVHTLYVASTFRFTYFGFGWVPMPPAWAIYALVLGALVFALGIAIGKAYRWMLLGFFLCFTYIELLDATLYLNHYYLVTALCLLLFVLPLNADLVVGRVARTVPRWTIWALRLQVGLVYFYAGIAKLNADWLVEAMPLRIWLAARGGLPVIGPLLDLDWMPWAMSWAGATFDLSIAFLLAYRPTRKAAYALAVAFHGATYVLFNIGIFPWMMMLVALVFFEADEFRALGDRLCRFTRPRATAAQHGIHSVSMPVRLPRAAQLIAALLLAFQLAFPLRHGLYPGNHLWTEEGLRFAWHVMVVEKTGHTDFHVTHPATGRSWVIPPDDLTPEQEKQLSVQPDFIWQYAQHVEQQFVAAGYDDVEVRAEAYVSFNGRRSQPLIDPAVDLTEAPRTLGSRSWILPHPAFSP